MSPALTTPVDPLQTTAAVPSAPLVSVVMSVYNGAEALPRTLQSVLSQERVDFEFIVINDGSTDGSGRILDEWAAGNARLRVIHQQNTGLTRALMRGCAEARGEFIARQDCGDVSLPGRLAVQAALLQQRPEVVLAACNYSLVGPADETLLEHDIAVDGVLDVPRTDGARIASPPHGTVMFRRDAYGRAGGYRAAFYFAQDLDLWHRLVELGEFAHVSENLCRLGFSESCLSARHRGAQQALRLLIFAATERRRVGEPEEPVLERASRIRPGADMPASRPTGASGAGDYFIGRCLMQRGDGAARRYLLRAWRAAPWNLKRLLRLLQAMFLPRKATVDRVSS